MRTLPYILLLVLAMASCSGGSGEVDPLDDVLQNILNEVTGGDGISHFRLPESDSLSQIPQDPNNPLTPEKVALGQLLFFDSRLSGNTRLESAKYTLSCATCHHPGAGFQSGIVQSIGEGGQGFGMDGKGRVLDPGYPLDSADVPSRKALPVLNTAFFDLAMWDGSLGGTGANIGTENQWIPGSLAENNLKGFSGMETRAIAAFEMHGLEIDKDYINSTEYKQRFESIFPPVGEIEQISVENAGLAIAAYLRTVMANRSPFQRWLRGQYKAMTDEQKIGAIQFFGKARCGNCHNNAALGSDEFHAIGMPDYPSDGIAGKLPTDAQRLGRGGFTGKFSEYYAYKTPQLYNLREVGFYGHGGTFRSLREVLDYKNEAVAINGDVPSSLISQDFQLLYLREYDILQILDFVENALHDPQLRRYQPAAVPSGNCIPNNDAQSRADLSCP